MEISELVAENIVNKLSALLKKKITVGNSHGDVLASSDLAETGKNYDQLRQSAETKKEIESTGTPSKLNLGEGLIIPIIYNGEVVGSVFIEDKQEEYSHYRRIVPTTIELLLYQNVIIDNFPYKEKIKDNFVFGLLHRKLSHEDSKVKEEAEMFDINLNRDKVIVIVNAAGYWQALFGEKPTASEDEKQMTLTNYKKRLLQALNQFFGRLSGCYVAYLGSDNFVMLVDELFSIDGREMVEMIRTKAEEFNALIKKQFEDVKYNRIMVGVGSFYRGKEGPVLAYEEARRALNLGLSIGEERTLYHIDDLGMIATLAGGNKKWQDNFVRRLLMKLIAEGYLLETVEVFFDRNMSLTQTAKELKIHRNTLLYRLDKIKKVTGLDPRKFNDAMELKVALILNKVLYLEKATVQV